MINNLNFYTNKLTPKGQEKLNLYKNKSIGMAWYFLAECYEKGKFGIEKDDQTAFKLYVESEKELPKADKNKVKGRFARIFKRNKQYDEYEKIAKSSTSPTIMMEYAEYLEKEKKDDELAIEYYKKATKYNEPEGFYKAALIYLKKSELIDIDNARDMAYKYFNEGENNKNKQDIFEKVHESYYKLLSDQGYEGKDIQEKITDFKNKAHNCGIDTNGRTLFFKIINWLRKNQEQLKTYGWVGSCVGFILTIIVALIRKK